MNAYKEWAKVHLIEMDRIKQVIEYRKELPYEEKGNLTEEEINEWYKEIESKFIEFKYYDFNFIPPELFTNLERIGKIKLTNEEKNSFFNKAVLEREKYIYEQFVQDSSLTTRYFDFIEQKEKGRFELKDMESIKIIAKKLSLYNYIQKNIE